MHYAYIRNMIMHGGLPEDQSIMNKQVSQKKVKPGNWVFRLSVGIFGERFLN